MFSFTETVEHQIEAEQTSAQERIVRNLRRLLITKKTVKCVNEPWAIFGDQYGVATESTVRKAVHALESAGELVVTVKSKQLRDMVILRPPYERRALASACHLRGVLDKEGEVPFNIFQAVVDSSSSRRQRHWLLVPGSPFQKTAAFLGGTSTPLLEEERHVCGLAAIA